MQFDTTICYNDFLSFSPSIFFYLFVKHKNCNSFFFFYYWRTFSNRVTSFPGRSPPRMHHRPLLRFSDRRRVSIRDERTRRSSAQPGNDLDTDIKDKDEPQSPTLNNSKNSEGTSSRWRFWKNFNPRPPEDDEPQ
jgi:hypothetical protein